MPTAIIMEIGEWIRHGSEVQFLLQLIAQWLPGLQCEAGIQLKRGSIMWLQLYTKWLEMLSKKVCAQSTLSKGWVLYTKNTLGYQNIAKHSLRISTAFPSFDTLLLPTPVPPYVSAITEWRWRHSGLLWRNWTLSWKLKTQGLPWTSKCGW